MATARVVMELAAKYVGTKEYPPDSNNVIFNTDYYGERYNAPWCCTFVWDIFRMANASKLFYDGKKVAYCPYVYNWGKRSGLSIPKSQGRYGDIVLFDWTGDGEADHIGFIAKQYSDGSYLTIEGNTAIGNDSNGGEVMYRTRYQYQICMIIRPKYTEEETVTYEEWKKFKAQYDADVAKQGASDGFQQKVTNWAYSIGITADKTQPQSPAKRWQIWAMFYRFAQYLGKEKEDKK